MSSGEFQLLRGSTSSRPSPHRPPWAIAERAFIQICNQCGDCISSCPENILVRGRGGYPQIDFSLGGCTFCGECARACQPGGLRPVDDHPWNQKIFIAQSCLSKQGTECRACGEHCSRSEQGSGTTGDWDRWRCRYRWPFDERCPFTAGRRPWPEDPRLRAENARSG